MKTAIERIGPDQARAYLATNIENNRKVANTHVLNLALAMQKGQWELNGQGIVISSSGKLIDGQHRMMAVIKSGCPCDFLVIRGVDEGCFKTLGSNKARGPADTLSTYGVSNCNVVAASVRLYLIYCGALLRNDGKGGSMNTYILPTHTDVLNEYQSSPEIYRMASRIGQNLKKVTTPTVASSSFVTIVKKGGHEPDKVAEFWRKVESAEMMMSKDPRLVLRDRLLRAKTDKNYRISSSCAMCMTIKAWNAFILGKEISILKYIDREPVPRVL